MEASEGVAFNLGEVAATSLLPTLSFARRSVCYNSNNVLWVIAQCNRTTGLRAHASQGDAGLFSAAVVVHWPPAFIPPSFTFCILT